MIIETGNTIGALVRYNNKWNAPESRQRVYVKEKIENIQYRTVATYTKRSRGHFLKRDTEERGEGGGGGREGEEDGRREKRDLKK